jgi:C1A family cysteine protease
VDINAPLDLDRLRSTLENAGGPWEMSYTTMTALTEQERVIRLGVPLEPGVDDAKREAERIAALAAHAAAPAGAIGAPASFDLRNVGGVNYTTSVKDQLSCGSCVAFGSAGAMEHVARYMRGTAALPVDLSEAHLFYCHGRAAGARCNTGWWPDQALAAARDKGVTFEDYYPYTPGDQTCTGLNADWPNRVAKVTEVQNISNNPAAMKEYISTYGSITACLEVYQDFFSYRTGIYKHLTGGLAGGHCVVLLGYDDAQRCWIGKNSWNAGWGDGGFFKIAYGECRIEAYQTMGVKGVSLRAWLPNQQILGLWSNEVDANVYAYGSLRGWIKVNGATVPTSNGLLAELAAAKGANRPVGIFEDKDSVQQVYAW